MFRSLLISLLTACLFLITHVDEALPAKKLYDDFSSGYLNDEKWWPREYVREILDGKLICKLGNSDGMGAETAPGIFRNNLDFNSALVDLNSIHTIQSEITVVEAILDNAATSPQSFARICGYFYNVNATGGATGDIFAMVMLGDRGNGLEAFWEVQKILSDDTDTWEVIGEGTIPVAETLEYGTPYVVKLSYTPADAPGIPDPTFTFSVNGQTAEFIGPQSSREAQIVYKSLGVGVNAIDGSNSGFVYAKFDDVILNDSQNVFDDFSETAMDASKWRSLDWVREASSGRLRANIRRIDSGSMVNTYFQIEKDTPYLEAKVRIESDSVLSDGAYAIARLAGYYYNETRGPGSGQPHNGFEGDVFAQIRLRYDSDGNLAAQVWVGRCEDADESSFTQLFWYDFSTEIMLDTYYNLSILFNNKQLSFRCNNEQIVFNIGTETYQPYGLHRQIRTWLYTDAGESGYIQASYDDVYVGTEPLSDAINALRVASQIPVNDVEVDSLDNNSNAKVGVEDAVMAMQIASDLRNLLEDIYHYDVHAYSGNFSSGYYSELYVIDINQKATSVTCTGPGISGTMDLVYNSDDKRWWHTYTPFLGASIPSNPQVYTFHINDESGTHTYEKTITGYVAEFASNLSPTGTVNNLTEFSWTGIPNATAYRIELSDSTGRIWSRHNIPSNTTNIAYNGPQLATGETYRYDVISIIVSGGETNRSFSSETFTITP